MCCCGNERFSVVVAHELMRTGVGDTDAHLWEGSFGENTKRRSVSEVPVKWMESCSGVIDDRQQFVGWMNLH